MKLSRTDILVCRVFFLSVTLGSGWTGRNACPTYLRMTTESDQARLVAERIARRVGGEKRATPARSRSATPPSSELAEIRSVLSDLQKKLDRVESKMSGEERTDVESTPRARFHNFVNSSAPANSGSTQAQPSSSRPSPKGAPSAVRNSDQTSADRFSEFMPPTHSPWLSGVYIPATHASQERFGVEEATVSELVEFFENEKKCSMEPGEKPCDHCDMCSSRGF
jgi:hypothetical protein